MRFSTTHGLTRPCAGHWMFFFCGAGTVPPEWLFAEASAILRQCVLECKKSQHIARRCINLSRTHPCPQERGCSGSVSDFSFVILSITRWSVMCLFSQRSRFHCVACCTAFCYSFDLSRQMFSASERATVTRVILDLPECKEP